MPLNISHWVLQTIAMMVTALLLPNLKVDGPIPAFLTVLAIAFINSHLWSSALFFEIPDSASAQALALLASNGAIFWIVVKILPGIECEGFLPALVAPVVFTASMMLISRYGDSIDWKALFEHAVELISQLRGYVTETPDNSRSSLQLGRYLTLLPRPLGASAC